MIRGWPAKKLVFVYALLDAGCSSEGPASCYSAATEVPSEFVSKSKLFSEGVLPIDRNFTTLLREVPLKVPGSIESGTTFESDVRYLAEVAERASRNLVKDITIGVGIVSKGPAGGYFEAHGLDTNIGRAKKIGHVTRGAELTRERHWRNVAHEAIHVLLPSLVHYNGDLVNGYWTDLGLDPTILPGGTPARDSKISTFATGLPISVSEGTLNNHWIDFETYAAAFVFLTGGLDQIWSGKSLVVQGKVSNRVIEEGRWYSTANSPITTEVPGGPLTVKILNSLGTMIFERNFTYDTESIEESEHRGEKKKDSKKNRLTNEFTAYIPFLPDAAKVQIVSNGRVTSEYLPSVKLLKDELQMVPDAAFIGSPQEGRSLLESVLNEVEILLLQEEYTRAWIAFQAEFLLKVTQVIRGDFSPQFALDRTQADILQEISFAIENAERNANDFGKPGAVAGADLTVLRNTVVQLDGSTSIDPNGIPLNYSWAIVSKPEASASVIVNSNTVNPTIQPDWPGTYVLSLTVSNGQKSSTDTVLIRVKLESPNQQPVAKAGFDRTADHGDLVTLDGSRSFDPDGNPLSFVWSMVSKPPGSKAELIDPTNVTAKFTADMVGDFIFSLRVSDSHLFSDPDRILIRVTPNNRRPVAVVNSDISLVGSGAVNLTGANSFDLDGDTLTYEWVLEQMPRGSAAQLSAPAQTTTSFFADKVGVYAARLTVHDGRLRSLPAYVKVRVNPVPNLAPIANAGPDQNVFTGTNVVLDGSASSDPENQTLSYNWSISSAPLGSTAELSGGNTVNPSLNLDLAGDYVISLVVSDGLLNSAPDFVTIHATLPGPAPGEIRLTKNGGQVSNHNSIQQAVNQSDAGSVIEVGAGTYAEDVRVNTKQNLTLKTNANAQIQALRILSSTDLTIDGFDVNASGQDRHAVQFPADNPSQNVSLKNLKVHGADPDFHGVNIGENSEGVEIRDSEVYGNGLHGINFHLSLGAAHLVENVDVHSNGRNGIRIPSGLEITVRNADIFSNGKHGIAAPDTDEVKINEEEERRFGKLVGNVLIEGSRIYANTVNGLAMASAGTSTLRTSEIRNNLANGVILNRTATDSATFLLETDNIHHNGSNGVRIATNHPVTLLANTIQENGTDTQSNARWGISRKKSGGEDPGTVMLTSNVITNNHGNVGNNKSLDLGNYDVLLDAGDSGNQTTANNEGPGVGGLVEKLKTIWNKYFQ